MNRPISSRLAPGPRRAGWLCAATAIIAIAAFLPVLNHGFILWDDGALITENPDINPPAPAQWGHYWTGTSRLYMPLTYAMWGLLAMVVRRDGTAGAPASLNPMVFHAASLALHAANAVLVFLLLRRLTRSVWPAFLGAMVFAVHPLQAEPVAWASETSILLGGAFSLLAILEFNRFAAWRIGDGIAASGAVDAPESTEGRGRAWPHYALGTIALVMALLCKPSSVVTPLLAGVIEVVLCRRPLRRIAPPLVPWFILCLPIAYITHLWQTTTVVVPLWQRPIVAADALAFYLYRLFLPVQLLPMYGRTPQWLMAHGVAMVSWLAPAALLIVSAALWRRARYVAAGALLFACGLLPVLGLNVFVFQHISTTADRYVYLSMLGPALIVAHALRGRPRALPMGAAAVVIVAMVLLSIRQSMFWSDTVTLFERVTDVHPDLRQAQELVALGYNVRSHEAAANNPREARELLQVASDHYEIAATLPGDDGISYFNAADCQFRLHRERQAIQLLRAALRDPRFELGPQAHDLMGVCFLGIHDPDRARACFEEAMRESPLPEQRGVHDIAERHLQRVRLFEQRPADTRPSPPPAGS